MLSHVDEQTNRPKMVDVSAKAVKPRTARARTFVQLPEAMKPFVAQNELILKKGPVFQTAIIAGTMAAKKTHELIPFCHQIPLESCKFEISMSADLLVTIECEIKTSAKTGVEMEALQGASAAALTVYDMCKAVSHQIVIQDLRLISKVGGKHTILDRPLCGLVLTGGKSERMKADKALLSYQDGIPHAQYVYETLVKYCDEVFLSTRPGQWAGTTLERLPSIEDCVNGKGPIVGILSAFAKRPDANWFVVACDLPHFGENTIESLLASYDPAAIATAYKNSVKGFPEPLCSIYTPSARAVFARALKEGITCPVKVLRSADVCTIDQPGGVNLANINTPEEFNEAHK